MVYWALLSQFFLVLLTGFEPGVYGSRVWCSTNWVTPSPQVNKYFAWWCERVAVCIVGWCECVRNGGNLCYSSIDLLKVGIPKLSTDAWIEQPHSRIAHAFKAEATREAAMLKTHWQYKIWVIWQKMHKFSLKEGTTKMVLKDIHHTDLHTVENGTECNDWLSRWTDTTRLELPFSVSICRHWKLSQVYVSWK